MAFADPQEVTINAVAVDLARTGSTGTSGTFGSADRELQLIVAHAAGKRFRHTARLNQSELVANPLVPDQNLSVGMSAMLIIDHPKNGYSAEQITDIVMGLVDWATPENVAKLVAHQN